MGCIPSKALLRNAELAHIFTQEAKTFGIEVDGQVRFNYAEAFRRSRRVADGRVRGVHYLMKCPRRPVTPLFPSAASHGRCR